MRSEWGSCNTLSCPSDDTCSFQVLSQITLKCGPAEQRLGLTEKQNKTGPTLKEMLETPVTSQNTTFSHKKALPTQRPTAANISTSWKCYFHIVQLNKLEVTQYDAWNMHQLRLPALRSIQSAKLGGGGKLLCPYCLSVTYITLTINLSQVKFLCSGHLKNRVEKIWEPTTKPSVIASWESWSLPSSTNTKQHIEKTKTKNTWVDKVTRKLPLFTNGILCGFWPKCTTTASVRRRELRFCYVFNNVKQLVVVFLWAHNPHDQSIQTKPSPSSHSTMTPFCQSPHRYCLPEGNQQAPRHL